MVAQALIDQSESEYENAVVNTGLHTPVAEIPFAKGMQHTLEIFNELSRQLGNSYQELEVKISELQGELVETDRLRLQELTEKEKLADRLECILEALPAAVITLDGSGKVIQANQSAIAILGEPLKGEEWISVIHRCFAPTPTDGHEIALKNGRLVSIATQSLGNEPGQIIVLNDLTETRKLQNQLNRHQKLSEMGRMTASLAHQVRTPLSTALLYADHLASDKLDAVRKKRYAGKLKERLLQLQSQVNDMLIFSKGGIVVNQKIAINEFLGKLFSRNLEQLERNHVAVVTEESSANPVISCNIDILISAFSNLIENSIQALLAQGNEFPRITIKVEMPKSGWVRVAVEDNGSGIPEAYLAQVKEPFFTTKSTGTGLGLAVVHAVAQSHGAEFTVANRVEGGACMALQFPVAQI